jgi:hypothetical protein
MSFQTLSRVFFMSIRTTRSSLLIAALVITTALAASAWALFSPEAKSASSTTTSKAEAIATSPPQNRYGKERVETELVTILPTGFNPSAITRPHGRFLILIDNRSGLEEVNVKLDRVGGHTLRAVRRMKDQLIWRQIEDLPPGEYLLTEGDHPDWVCRIKITPR